jgi:hypothetical protein
LSAGHCISIEPYGVIRNQPSTAQVQFNFFVDTTARRVTVRARVIGWSTMKGVDLALVELGATLGDLAAQGIRPLRLASSEPQAGRAVFWTGISGSPIPPELQFLRLGRCTVGNTVQLIEGSWIWNNDLSNDCPDLYAGASGSPLFDAASGDVIGVVSTTTLLNFEHGPDYDQINRPCVIIRGPEIERDTSYAAPVQGIGRCFDQTNALDLARPGCPLDPGFQLTVQSGPNEVQPQASGNPATWGAALSGSQSYYSYKRFTAGEDSCGTASGYSAPILVPAPVILDPIGREELSLPLRDLATPLPSTHPGSSLLMPRRFKRPTASPRVLITNSNAESGLSTDLPERRWGVIRVGYTDGEKGSARIDGLLRSAGLSRSDLDTRHHQKQ